jgi:D-amino-acid dehydrogenase
VIGAGIVGSSCAWHLQRRGAQVSLIDSEMPGQSTSFGNAGCISKTSVFPFSYPGVIRKLPGWLLDSEGPVRIRWSQLPRVAPWLYRFWRAGSRRRVAEIDAWKYRERDRLGLGWRRLGLDELTALEPRVRLGHGVALFEPLWQHITDPGGLTAGIADAAVERGAHWIRDRVRSVFSNASGVTVDTESGRSIEADRVILATGVWSNRLLAPLGLRVPLMPKRGYHTMFAQPGIELNHPIMSASRHVLVTPMADGLRVSGTAEFAELDAPPDYARARALVSSARHFLPDLEGAGVSEWMGQRPMMADSLPVLGPLPGRENVVCAFGHGHYGLTQGPGTGKLVARLVFGDDPGVDLAPFSVTRF